MLLSRRMHVVMVQLAILLIMMINAHAFSFDYKPYLSEPPSTLAIWAESVAADKGEVIINGAETQQVVKAFKMEWGDGTSTNGYFPFKHTYADRSKNYVIRITSYYRDSKMASAELLIPFLRMSAFDWSDSSGRYDVAIPAVAPVLGYHWYSSPQLQAFDDGYFSALSRRTVESLLSAAAVIQADLVNDDLYRFENRFRQVMLLDNNAGGAYSLWFTDPVSFGVGPALFRNVPDFSSLFHEMGHNFTLNTPAAFHFGGRIDGSANAIFSEAMAQIFQHATGYELLNNAQFYGIPEDLAFAVKQSLISSFRVTRSFYDKFLAQGKPYSSWNDPQTPDDETLFTFGTIAYKFIEHAEQQGGGYRTPLKRMMNRLQLFNPSWQARYDQHNNTTAADTFRATLMVSALSYAFSTDLRAEFRELRFPINDRTYAMITKEGTNTAPQAAAAPADLTLEPAQLAEISLNSPVQFFMDPDLDELEVLAVSSDTVVAAAEIRSGALHVTARRPGISRITLFADDQRGGWAQTGFFLTVNGGKTFSFSYQNLLRNGAHGLNSRINAIDKSKGLVEIIGGSDLAGPVWPLQFVWGDGVRDYGWWPISHVYTDLSRDYRVAVIAGYEDGAVDTVWVPVYFRPPTVEEKAFVSSTVVRIPNEPLSLSGIMRDYFDDSFFEAVPRRTVEYILSADAFIETQMVNDDVHRYTGRYEQVIMRDDSFPGAASGWNTWPISTIAHSVFLRPRIAYSSFFHEGGHNVTINTPTQYHLYGAFNGPLDQLYRGSSIYSETLAQIFQHLSGAELVSRAAEFGISPELRDDIIVDLYGTFSFLKQQRDDLIAGGYTPGFWDRDGTSTDECWYAFMTLAYTFIDLVEKGGNGYVIPVQRMMRIFQDFRLGMVSGYDMTNGTAQSDTLRSTVMIAGLSYGLDSDLRPYFRSLNFPVSDRVFLLVLSGRGGLTHVEEQHAPESYALSQNYPNPFNHRTLFTYSLPQKEKVSFSIYNMQGQLIQELFAGAREPGSYTVSWDASGKSSGTYLARYQAGSFVTIRKCVLLK